jgi:hypothetical protein
MITAIILTKNEEKNINECIASLSFCDEILVIDDNSTDKTGEIAKKAGATVLIHSLEHDFSAQRNFGLQKAKGEWVIFIDADERVSKQLQKEILEKVVQEKDTNGFFVQRVDFMRSKMLTHGETAHSLFLRLAKKGEGKWKGQVHETWQVTGKTGQLRAPLFHYPHQTIREFLAEINYYTDLRAKELFEQGIQVSWLSILFYPKMKFLHNYIVRQGFRDGTEGVIMALMMSFHSFLVRGKLWQLWDQKTSSH